MLFLLKPIYTIHVLNFFVYLFDRALRNQRRTMYWWCTFVCQLWPSPQYQETYRLTWYGWIVWQNM